MAKKVRFCYFLTEKSIKSFGVKKEQQRTFLGIFYKQSHFIFFTINALLLKK